MQSAKKKHRLRLLKMQEYLPTRLKKSELVYQSLMTVLWFIRLALSMVTSTIPTRLMHSLEQLPINPSKVLRNTPL